jgi:hypothetical protein
MLRVISSAIMSASVALALSRQFLKHLWSDASIFNFVLLAHMQQYVFRAPKNKTFLVRSPTIHPAPDEEEKKAEKLNIWANPRASI